MIYYFNTTFNTKLNTLSGLAFQILPVPVIRKECRCAIKKHHTLEFWQLTHNGTCCRCFVQFDLDGSDVGEVRVVAWSLGLVVCSGEETILKDELGEDCQKGSDLRRRLRQVSMMPCTAFQSLFRPRLPGFLWSTIEIKGLCGKIRRRL